MRNLILITFEGCPLAGKSRDMLSEIGVKFMDVEQDNLPINDPHRFYSSPTLLEGERIIFGSRLDSGARACTLILPTLAQLKKMLLDE